MRTAEANRALANEFIERGLNAQDLGYIDSMLTDEFVERSPGDPSMGNDKKAAMATFEWLFGAFPDVRYEVLEIVATPDRVAIRSRGSGTDSGTGVGAPMGAGPTGEPFAIEGIDVVAVDDQGRLTEHYGIYDIPALLTQVGLMPAPTGP